jgi:hypothetical protein
MNDSPPPVALKKRRVRKIRKSGSATDASAHSIVAQPSCQENYNQENYNQDNGQDSHQENHYEGTDIVALPLEKKKRTRRPRKRKTDVEARADMIVPTDPIVSAPPAPLKLAVPVGLPFPAVPPKPVKLPRLPAALPPQIVAIRASMPVPVECNREDPTARTGRRLSAFLSRGRHALSQAAGVPRRHPRSTGLVMTAILLGISLTTAVILSDVPKPDATGQATDASPILAAAPAAPSVQEALTRMPEESDALAGIRIVDPLWDKKVSCSEGAWPYIDQRCLEAKSAARTENKIGPGMIAPRARPAAPETSGPIGSTTAIVPAAPKAPVTDGVAPRDLELQKDEEKGAQPAPKVAPSQLAETRTSTIPPETATPRYSRPSPRYASSAQTRYAPSTQRRQPVRTFRLSEETKPVVTRQWRAAGVKRKRQPYVADAGRRSRERIINQAQAPQAPQFFFPFGWFVQAR